MWKAKGKTVYGEKLITDNNIEYREWNATRSKLAAAVLNGIKEIGINGSRKLLMARKNGV